MEKNPTANKSTWPPHHAIIQTNVQTNAVYFWAGFDMRAVRRIVDAGEGSVTIPIPQYFCNHKVEVILLPYEEVVPISAAEWPAGFLDRLVGCMQDDPIRRFSQGSFEDRTELK